MDAGNSEPAPPTLPRSKNDSSRQIVRNVMMGYAGAGLVIVSGLVVTPLLVRRLGSEQFGLWALLSSVVAWLGLIDLGISTTIVKRVAEYMAGDDHKRLDELVRTGQFLFCAAALLAMIVGTMLAVLIGSLFHVSPRLLQTARLALFIMTINQAAQFVGIVQTAVVIGMGRLDILDQVGLWAGIVVTAGELAAAFAGAGVAGLAVVTLAGTLLSLSTVYLILHRQLAGVRFSPRLGSWPVTRELIKFGSQNAGVALAGALSYGADTLIVGALFPVAAVGQYAIAFRIAGFPRTLAAKPIDVLMPVYSHSHALGEHDRMQRLFLQSITFSLMMIIPVLLSVIVFGREIIRLWVGPGHDASYGIAVVLLLAFTLQLPGHACFTILTGTEKMKYLVKFCIGVAVGNVALSVALAILLGPIGVALATLAAVAACDTVLLPYWVCRQFGFRLQAYFGEALVPLLLPTIYAGAAAFALHQLPMLRQELWPLAAIGVIGCVFFGASWNSSVSRQFRTLIKQKLEKKFGRKPAVQT